jgi:hypothetical protein
MGHDYPRAIWKEWVTIWSGFVQAAATA